MTNQASEDRLRAELAQYLESTYQDGAVMATRPNSGYHKRVDEFTEKLLALIRTEKLKLLAEVRERVVQSLPDTAFHGTSIRVKENIRDGGYHDGVLDSRLATEETLTKLEAEL